MLKISICLIFFTVLSSLKQRGAKIELLHRSNFLKSYIMSISVRVPLAHVSQKKVTRSIRVCNVCLHGCDCCQSIEEEETIFVSQICSDGSQHEVFPFGEDFGTSISSSRGDELMPHVRII